MPDKHFNPRDFRFRTLESHEKEYHFRQRLTNRKTLCFDADYISMKFSILITNIKFHYDQWNPSTRQMTTDPRSMNTLVNLRWDYFRENYRRWKVRIAFIFVTEIFKRFTNLNTSWWSNIFLGWRQLKFTPGLLDFRIFFGRYKIFVIARVIHWKHFLKNFNSTCCFVHRILYLLHHCFTDLLFMSLWFSTYIRKQ